MLNNIEERNAIDTRNSLSVGVLPKTETALNLIWLELTGKCNLECIHCYASSSPQGSHGEMLQKDWLRVIHQARALGCQEMTFIGGEPTIHPAFETLLREAHRVGFDSEVYTNLLSVPESRWRTFQDCKVRLATSFYSSHSDVHDHITLRQGSYKKTLSNIERAVGAAIPIRVGVIAVDETEDAQETERLLRSVGVTQIGHDRVRGVGRGTAKHNTSLNELCGRCADERLAIAPDGHAYPCVFARWLPVGDVRTQSLEEILLSIPMRDTKHLLEDSFRQRAASCAQDSQCNPAHNPPICCKPNNCKPDGCQTN